MKQKTIIILLSVLVVVMVVDRLLPEKEQTPYKEMYEESVKREKQKDSIIYKSNQDVKRLEAKLIHVDSAHVNIPKDTLRKRGSTLYDRHRIK